jgi:Zn-dependent metalloprotease
MKKFYNLVFPVILLFCGAVYAQKPSVRKNEAILIRFSSQNNSKANPAKDNIEQHLGLSKNSKLVRQHTTTDHSGFTHERVQQYYKNIKVEYGTYNVLSKNGQLTSISGEKYDIAADLTIQPALTEKAALQNALQYVGARSYKWQIAEEEAWLKVQENNAAATYFPTGELVICKVFLNGKRGMDNETALAYKFDIYAHEPLSRAYIYVDAQNGRIIHTDAIIKHATGTAATRYSGSRNIHTEKLDTTHRLRDYSRGAGIETYNLRNTTSYGSAVDFFDKDNNWTEAEFNNSLNDNAALDAHWGATMTYDYFRNVHGRNSFDGKGKIIKNYVHYSRNYPNAFWNGSVMTYGDGGNVNGVVVQPFVTLDIVAHEIGHAVCDNTARLVYSYESGALNEGFSDIWAATIEHHTDPSKKTWLLGEETNVTFRSMSNPKAYQQPDTYLGQFWYIGTADNGGVHINSSVLNHWFYILSIGKTGVNDHGDAYTVNGISIQKAAQIAYRTESTYLTANSRYADMRKFSIQAAIDLYGANSTEATQTANAWYAVGVYDNESAPSGLMATVITDTQVNLSWKDNSAGETGFIIERSLSSGKDFVQVATVGANVTRYTNKDVPANALYYYRVRAQIGQMRSGFSNEVNAVLGYATIAMSNNTISTCQAVFLDPGATENYANGLKTIMSFSPSTPGSKLRVTFSAFDLEANYDYLIVYDGANTSAPFIGKYTGTSLPPVITATNAAGQLTFYFISDEIINKTGWIATLSCTGGTAPAPTITSFSPESGTPGESIIITGTNFNGATAVKFNDTPAEFTINSNTQITAIVPATASKGSISISTASGTHQSASFFTVTPVITLSGLTYTYDGSPKSVQVSTIPANLPVSITYNNLSALPVNAGTYEITVIVNSSDYRGSATGTFTINRAEATIQLSSLTQTYTGTSLSPAITTVPANLPVSLTYNGSALAPVNAGTYTVAASIASPNYTGTIQATLLIKKAPAKLSFAQQQQTFTGTPKSVAVTTTPAGLTVNLMYNNASAAPINAGSYDVTATITDANFEGSANSTLIVNKASQVINFEALSDRTFGDAAFTLIARATSQMPINFTVVKGAALIIDNVVNLTGAGQVTIKATQAGNENFLEAAAIEKTICVKPAKPVITSSQAKAGSLFTLTSSSALGNEWLLNGEPIAGATEQIYQVTQAGIYSVRVTIDACNNISDEVVLTAALNPFLASSIQLYPNPASDRIAINVAGVHGTGECVATVYNVLGEKVAQKVLDYQTEGWQAELGISHLAAGRYIVQITNGQHKYSKTFVKQ